MIGIYKRDIDTSPGCRQRTADFVASHGTSEATGYLFWGGLKEFADGSLGSSTALFHEPYVGSEGQEGVRNIATAKLQKLVQDADQAGLQVAIHAIGDLAVEEVRIYCYHYCSEMIDSS